mmetsp:Transcript_35772/g.57849  ORF Transcript_35772/g.57849 Transcript_35772/m.57849 type:complete len:200 (+) Transcript_35772:164-763(+)|eukprot:CAMPEP_0184671266 /NCGR_PEP_ID=MMETSP0308-20130426/85391_1 /TAXON_ID=38269 /ORGANISM="Gloeochaete witrockiana, Strain SAG 46.84" /LENGTH=199 /DNA_ID=CAMNT_0027118349 /DNA_START=147 /DNA_END=746 /DNA_ORIENTATION=+
MSCCILSSASLRSRLLIFLTIILLYELVPILGHLDHEVPHGAEESMSSAPELTGHVHDKCHPARRLPYCNFVDWEVYTWGKPELVDEAVRGLMMSVSVYGKKAGASRTCIEAVRYYMCAAKFRKCGEHAEGEDCPAPEPPCRSVCEYVASVCPSEFFPGDKCTSDPESGCHDMSNLSCGSLRQCVESFAMQQEAAGSGD